MKKEGGGGEGGGEEGGGRGRGKKVEEVFQLQEAKVVICKFMNKATTSAYHKTTTALMHLFPYDIHF